MFFSQSPGRFLIGLTKMVKKQINTRLTDETISKVKKSGIHYETLIKYGLAYFEDVKQQNLTEITTDKKFSVVNYRINYLLNRVSEIEIRLKKLDEGK